MLDVIKDKMEQGGGNPVGTIISFMGNTVPKGYLYCDGTVYNIEDYSELADFIETEFETKNYFGGDGTTTFAVPDLQGEFLRCTGTNSHTNQGSGDNVGVHQDGTVILATNSNLSSASSTLTMAPHVGGGAGNGNFIDADKSITVSNHSWANFSGNKLSGSGTNFTTRPTNTCVKFCIKF